MGHAMSEDVVKGGPGRPRKIEPQRSSEREPMPGDVDYFPGDVIDERERLRPPADDFANRPARSALSEDNPGPMPGLPPIESFDADYETADPENLDDYPEGFVRKPFGNAEQRLVGPNRPGYHRHWFNDRPGRVARAIEAGYKHVTDSDGTPVKRIVGVSQFGGPEVAYRMEIPQKWFDADMAKNAEEDDRIAAQIEGGEVGHKEGDERYVPDKGRGIRISRG